MTTPPVPSANVHDKPEPVVLPKPFADALAELTKWVDAKLDGENLQNADPLYHYTSLKGCVGLIESDEIWHTSIFQMNDPDELRFTYALLRRTLKWKMVYDKRVRFVFGGFWKSAKKIPQWLPAFVASFSRDPGGEYQWKEYGDQHRGVCIVLGPHLFKPNQGSAAGLHPLEQVFVSEVK